MIKQIYWVHQSLFWKRQTKIYWILGDRIKRKLKEEYLLRHQKIKNQSKARGQTWFGKKWLSSTLRIVTPNRNMFDNSYFLE